MLFEVDSFVIGLQMGAKRCEEDIEALWLMREKRAGDKAQENKTEKRKPRMPRDLIC